MTTLHWWLGVLVIVGAVLVSGWLMRPVEAQVRIRVHTIGVVEGRFAETRSGDPLAVCVTAGVGGISCVPVR